MNNEPANADRAGVTGGSADAVAPSARAKKRKSLAGTASEGYCGFMSVTSIEPFRCDVPKHWLQRFLTFRHKKVRVCWRSPPLDSVSVCHLAYRARYGISDMSRIRIHVAQRGVTLLELVMAIAVLAILIAIAVPSFLWSINRGHITSQANELAATIQLARTEAMRRGRYTALCRTDDFDSAKASCSHATGNWGGWIAFVDTNADGQRSSDEELLKTVKVSERTVVVSSESISRASELVLFTPEGYAARDGDAPLDAQIRICVASTIPSDNVRDVAIRSGSRISVSRKDGAGTCAAPTDIS